VVQIPILQDFKILALLALFFIGQLLCGQEQTATEEEIQKIITQSQKKSVLDNFYLGFGLGILDSPKINALLQENEIAEIEQNGLLIGFGLTFRISENDFLDFEMNLNSSRNREENFGNSFSELGIHLHYHREFLQVGENYSLSFGAQTSYIDTNMEIYQRNQIVDLTNENFSGNRLSVSYPSFRLGPSLALNWKDTNSGNIFMRIQLQYEINVYSSGWNLDDGQLNNRINEHLNRFNLKLILPLL